MNQHLELQEILQSVIEKSLNLFKCFELQCVGPKSGNSFGSKGKVVQEFFIQSLPQKK